VGKDYELIVKNKNGERFTEKEKSSDTSKSKDDYKGIAFLLPFTIWDNVAFRMIRDYRALRVLKGIYNMMDKDVLFKPHQAYPELVEPFLPPDRIIWDNADELIRKYDKIYCFSECSIRKDCEMLGKEYEIIDKEGFEEEINAR